jgi:copper transport protein
VPPRGIKVALKSLGKGVYTVSWRVVSRVDGHFTAGAYAFGVGVSPSEIENADVPAASGSSPSPWEVAGRAVLYAGLFLLLGSAFVFGFVLQAASGSNLGDRARFVAGAGLALSVVGLSLLAFAQARSAQASVADLLSTPIGRALLGRAIGVGIAVAAVVVALLTGRRLAWDVLGVAAGATIFVHTSAGHAAAGGLVVPKVILQFVHFSAAGVWIGGLAALLVAIRGLEPEARSRAVRRYSTVAGVALFAVAATGTVRAVQEVDTWGALLSTGYGRAVLGKIFGVCVLGGLGVLQRYRSMRAVAEDPAPLTRVGKTELVVAAAVLVVAGLLASLAPAKSLGDDRQSVIVSGADFGRSVEATLEITPGQAGVNAFTVTLDIKRGPRARGVTITFTSLAGDVEPSKLALERDGDRFVARSSAIATPGRWRAVLLADRGADSVEVPLVFHTACPEGRVQMAGDLTLRTIDLGGGRTVQVYVDPAKAGTNEVHFTFFDAKGVEFPVAQGRMDAAKGDRAVDLKPDKLSAGHFVANARLTKGDWLFDFMGETKGGDRMTVCFEETIK